MSENGEIYTAGKYFTLPPAVTPLTNSTSVLLLPLLLILLLILLMLLLLLGNHISTERQILAGMGLDGNIKIGIKCSGQDVED